MRKLHVSAAPSGRNAPFCEAGMKTRHLDKLRFYGLDGLGSVAGQPLRKKPSEALGEHAVRIRQEVDEAVFLYLCRYIHRGEAPKRR